MRHALADGCGLGRAVVAPLALLVLSAVPTRAPASTLEYVVQPGETLWSIAAQEQVLGDPYLWPLLYKFNRDQIKDPSRIYPSQRLQIPVEPDSAARSAARNEAGAPAPVGGGRP